MLEISASGKVRMRRSPHEVLVHTLPHAPMPADVRHAFVGHGVITAFKTRPAYQQADYLRWIERTRLARTRRERIAEVVDELQRGNRFMKAPWRNRQGLMRSA